MYGLCRDGGVLRGKKMSSHMQVVLLDDVDFIVSLGLSHPAQYQAIVQATRRRGAIVVPAFEPAASFRLSEGRKLALDTVQLEGGYPHSCSISFASFDTRPLQRLATISLDNWIVLN